MIQNAETNVTFVDAQFKDSTPEATVQRIRSILTANGIHVTEEWRETSVPYCYALSVRIDGTSFSTNGKGLSREFARASAYGELMERLQIGAIFKAGMQKDGTQAFSTGEGVYASAKKLMERNGSWYERMAQRLKRFTGIAIDPEEILTALADGQGNIILLPYYCLTTGTQEYFPKKLLSPVYSTNGCAAGNSSEETLVQALSEIVERHHMMQINDGGYSLPDIPEEVLKQFKTAYSIITFLRSQGFRVIVKDCSLGKRFPVVNVYIIDTRTGRYHTHFGAYPILEIALERALTETFQGKNIQNVTRFEDVLFKKPGEFSFTSVSNDFIVGTHEKGLSFFVGTPRYEYNESMGFQGGDNQALLQECIAFFKEQRLDILVRDHSCLGFRTFQVLIPGYSETFIHRLAPGQNEFRYKAFSTKTLKNPSAATFQDYLGTILHLEQMDNSFTSNISGVHGFIAASKLAADLTPQQSNYLMSASLAYIYYAIGQHNQVITCINAMLPACTDSEADYLICLKRYLAMKQNRRTPEETRQLLDYFHQPETVEKLYTCLSSNANPLEEFTLHCQPGACADCRIKKECQENRVSELVALIRKKSNELDFNRFCEELKSLT